MSFRELRVRCFSLPVVVLSRDSRCVSSHGNFHRYTPIFKDKVTDFSGSNVAGHDCDLCPTFEERCEGSSGSSRITVTFRSGYWRIRSAVQASTKGFIVLGAEMVRSVGYRILSDIGRGCQDRWSDIPEPNSPVEVPPALLSRLNRR